VSSTSTLRRVAHHPHIAARPGRISRGRTGAVRIAAGSGLVVFSLGVALAGPALAPHDPRSFLAVPYAAPSSRYPLGTDVLGRDVLSELLAGGRLFLLQGIAATVLGVGLGVLAGVVLATVARRIADVLLSVNDIVIVLPQIVIVLLVLTRLGSTNLTLIIVIGVVHVPQSARVVRAAADRVVTAEYFEAALGIGTPWRRLLGGEILPNVLSVILLEFSIRLAMSVVVLASLSYLGFGAAGLAWGRMIYDNQGGLSIQPWAVLSPVLLIGMFLIGANLLRDGITRRLES
jgi:peptide/nickel transport system permease protein